MGFAFNQTRQNYLAKRLSVARTHWTRLRGLLGKNAADFSAGCGLWIVPCHGVHSLGMTITIDVLYLDRENIVIYMTQLKPWRIAPVMRQSVSVLELPPGTLETTGTKTGDKIEIAFPNPEAAPA